MFSLKHSLFLFVIAGLCGQGIAAEIGFKNEVPDPDVWIYEGEEPLTLLDDSGKKVLDFKDASESAAISLTRQIDENEAADMVEKGFELKIRLKSELDVPESGNVVVFDVRLKGLAPMALVLWHSPGWRSMGVSSYDIVADKHTGIELGDAFERYVEVKARYVPEPTGESAGQWIVEPDNAEKYEGAVGYQEGSGQNVIQISSNGADPVRQSRWLIDSFVITMP